jgi:hypothetical protein
MIYKLFLLAKLLIAEKDAEQITYDFSFWLTEYPLKPYPTPRELPGLKNRAIEPMCWVPPHKYDGVKLTWKFSGGILLAYAPYLLDFWQSRGFYSLK